MRKSSLKKMALRLAAAMALGFPVGASARVFNFGSESFAPYLKGSLGYRVENTLLSKSNTTEAIVIDQDPNFKYNFSGEFGFTYASPMIAVRFGIEVITPPNIKDSRGKDAAGTDLYSVNSEVSAVTPKVGFEFTLKRWPTKRLFLYTGVGMSTLVARNSYEFMASSPYGLADYYEDLRGSGTMYEGALGIEMLAFDTTTVAFDVGYRSLNFTKVTHNRDVTTFQGTVAKGADATNMDGSARTLNLSGPYASMIIRFWIF